MIYRYLSNFRFKCSFLEVSVYFDSVLFSSDFHSARHLEHGLIELPMTGDKEAREIRSVSFRS